jgi:putative heme-binding domain-containing protein
MCGQLAFRESAFCALVLLLAAGGPARGQTIRGDYGAADIGYGARLYTMHCAQCHGATGDQVGTVDLRSGKFKNASTDQQLMNLVTSGIPAGGMPSFKFDSAELTGIVAYLRNMNTFDAASVPVGNADRGRALFEGKGGCRTCHQVDGRGAGLAPDLGDIGAIRTAAALQAAILDPSAAMLPINRPVRAVTKNGRTVNGRRLNEDTFTVQLMDDRGALLSLVKDDLREYRVLTQSPMPAYSGKLTSAEVADLVAYLLTLKGG